MRSRPHCSCIRSAMRRTLNSLNSIWELRKERGVVVCSVDMEGELSSVLNSSICGYLKFYIFGRRNMFAGSDTTAVIKSINKLPRDSNNTATEAPARIGCFDSQRLVPKPRRVYFVIRCLLQFLEHLVYYLVVYAFLVKDAIVYPAKPVSIRVRFSRLYQPRRLLVVDGMVQ